MARKPSSYLLPRLHRLARRQDENYFTECLAYLISAFLEFEADCAECLLECLRGPVELSIHAGTPISVHTQFSIEDRSLVDLVLKTDDAIVFIEVKIGSGFHFGQLEQYRSALLRREEGRKALGILTRDVPNPSKNSADFRVSWFEVGTVVRSVKPVTQVGKHIRNEFLNLLRHRGLNMSRVSWELKKGLRSFVSLFEMLNQSIQPHVDKGEVSRSTVTTAQSYFGYYIWINDTKFFVGMYFSEPGRIYVSNEEEINLPENIETGELIEDGWWQCKIDLDTEDAHFFARSLQSQRNYLQQTVNEAIEFAGNLAG